MVRGCCGGVPVLAHPFQYKKSDAELRELIERCMDHGLRGIECRYSGYSPEQSAYLERLAEEYGLLKTGGSDYHGSHKPHISLGSGIDGNLEVPYAWLEKLREAAGECRGCLKRQPPKKRKEQRRAAAKTAALFTAC